MPEPKDSGTRLFRRLRSFVLAGAIGALTACAAPQAPQTPHTPATSETSPSPTESATASIAPTYASLGDDAVRSMLQFFYAGKGLWRDCPDLRCSVHNSDWGSDALTNTLYLRWKTTRDVRMPAIFAALARTSREYQPCRRGQRCELWSDVPMWDSVAASREYDALHTDPLPLRKAKAAFWAVESSDVYARGACPAIRYQRPFGRGDRLKTLETDSNAIKAALLLYGSTHERRYLRIARTRYQAVRRYFLDAHVPLYSVYVFDDGVHCTQSPHRYFASVNGNMIWNGVQLAHATGESHYRTEAYETARAVVHNLSDSNGIFSDLQAENDLEEPLVEAMLSLATEERRSFARTWILANAAAAYSARRSDGSYGRFFDGPPPTGTVSAWQTNGGYAIQLAAASLEPRTTVGPPAWNEATFVPREITRMPATIRFNGSGIAIIGTIGEVCCQPGHARILIDGVETINGVGTWQNKSSSGRRFPDAVLFAWRWPQAAVHEITLQPGIYDAKEGGPFLHARGYQVLGQSTTEAYAEPEPSLTMLP